MGLLLSFMFLWNMLGAMVLLPSLAYFLLPPRLFLPAAVPVMASAASPGLLQAGAGQARSADLEVSKK
jgi:hypothetical protein